MGASQDDDAGEASGSAYVFRRDDNGTPSDPSDDSWVEEAKLTASDASEHDQFGISVCVSADRAVVGAIWADAPGISYPGSAYVFRCDDNGTPSDPTDDFWVQEAKLNASDAASSDHFGHSVAISGDRGIVGAWFDDDAGENSGSAYVFRRDDNGTPLDPSDDLWAQEVKLTASDAAADDLFGHPVSITGNRAVVGAFRGDAPGVSDAGSAYVFRRDDNGTPSDPSDDFWVEEAKLVASDPDWDDSFGISVSVSGERTIVGAHHDSGFGAVYVFRRDDNGTPSDPSDDTWLEEAKLTASDVGGGDFFGYSVGVSGLRAVVGAYDWDALGASNVGAAYVFRRDDNDTPSDPSDDSWVEEAKLTASDASEHDQFGISVSVSGESAIVGAYYDDDAGTDSGSAYFFDLVGTDCNENGIHDECDIADGTSQDINGNSIPDECEPGACCLPDETCVTHMNYEDCESQGGIYAGGATKCACWPEPPIPAISEWGMVVMTLLVLMAATLVFIRRSPART